MRGNDRKVLLLPLIIIICILMIGTIQGIQEYITKHREKTYNRNTISE